MPFTIDNLDTREAIKGLTIGTLAGDSGETYTVHAGWANVTASGVLTLDNNSLKLGADWHLDFESKRAIKTSFTLDDGRISGFNFTNWGDWSGVDTESTDDDFDINIPVDTNGNWLGEWVRFNLTDVDEGVSFAPTPVNENEYGAAIGTVTINDPTVFSEVNFIGPGFLEISGNQLKLKDEYEFNSEGWADRDPSGGFWGWKVTDTDSPFLSDGNDLYLGVGSSGHTLLGTFENGLGAETIFTAQEQIDQIFGSDITIKNPKITLTPINFEENKLGEIIAEISMPEGSASIFGFYKLDDPDNGNFNFVQEDQAYLEIIVDDGKYKIKLGDDYFYNHNTGRIQQKDFNGYKLEDQDNSLSITALDINGKPIVTEEFPISELVNNIFSESNVTNNEVSKLWVTDIKFTVPDLPNTGREEYQKNVDYHWELNPGEKIQYSFVDNSSDHYGTYAELDGNGLVTPTQDFKNAHRAAFDTWSDFIDVEFEEIDETSENVGDWRIGITDKNHFMPDSVDDPETPEDESEPWTEYAAYSQGVSAHPSGGNLFYNGFPDGYDTKDDTGQDGADGTLDWNQSANMQENSHNYKTLIHEIGHSLGLKHPFEAFPETSDLYGNGANKFQDQYDQNRYSIMSYTDNRDYDDPTSKYDGTQIELSDGSMKNWLPKTPMLYDVMSLQEVYGASKSSSPGDTVYEYTETNVPYETIYDTGGKDTLDLSSLTGGAQLKLGGDELSTVGENYLLPWRTGDDGFSEAGTPQPGVLGIINASSRGGVNTQIEKVKLPSDISTIETGEYSTLLIGKQDSTINVTVNADQLGIKALGNADDTITLAQITKTWGSNVKAKHTGNEGGKGATNIEIKDMTKYLKHDLSLDLAGGSNSLNGTNGNDAIFLQNLVTKGDTNWLAEMGQATDAIYSGERLIGLTNINLGDGDNLLDLSGADTSLNGESISVTVGSGQDILWLSDANETIETGSGNDEIIVNGGTDTIATGNDSDKITIADNVGNLTISDFDPVKDKLVFGVSENKVSVNGETITVSNTVGDYIITLTGNNFTDLTGTAFSFA